MREAYPHPLVSRASSGARYRVSTCAGAFLTYSKASARATSASLSMCACSSGRLGTRPRLRSSSPGFNAVQTTLRSRDPVPTHRSFPREDNLPSASAPGRWAHVRSLPRVQRAPQWPRQGWSRPAAPRGQVRPSPRRSRPGFIRPSRETLANSSGSVGPSFRQSAATGKVPGFQQSDPQPRQTIVMSPLFAPLPRSRR